MRNRKRVLLLCAFVVVAVALVALSVRDPEPRYHGRPLSKWVRLYSSQAYTQDSDFEEAAEAIRALGTNTLPHLLRWLRDEPPPWQRAALKILPNTVAKSPLATF